MFCAEAKDQACVGVGENLEIVRGLERWRCLFGSNPSVMPRMQEEKKSDDKTTSCDKTPICLSLR